MFLFAISALTVIFFILSVATLLGKREKKSFEQNNSATVRDIMGILLGTVVGGASTVGTVEAAYAIGFSAIWFTMGISFCCIGLGVFFAVKIRKSGSHSISEIMRDRYGERTATLTTFTSTSGTFLSMMAQILASTALIIGVIPVSVSVAAFLAIAVIAFFILSGGMKSFSLLGTAKIYCLYGAMLLCCYCAFRDGYTPLKILRTLPANPWFNPFSQGLGKSLLSVASLAVGIFSTQIYMQALFLARDTESAKKGAFFSGLMIPPLGFLGVWMGLSVRAAGVEIPPGSAFTWFLFHHLSPIVAGSIWGIFFVTTIASAAGLAIGIVSHISAESYPAVRRKMPQLTQKRYFDLILVILLFLGVFATVSFPQSTILSWSFHSMALRGAGLFLPFLLAINNYNPLPPTYAFLSVLLGFIAVLTASSFTTVHPLVVGFAVSCALVLLGTYAGSLKKSFSK